MSTTEADVGITEYANDLRGFSGILKHRYTDFKVNEVDWQGQVVRLTSLGVPQPIGQSQHRQEVEAAPANDSVDLEAAVAPLTELAGAPEGLRVRCFLQQALAWQAACQESGATRASRPDAPAPLVLEPIANKDTRKAVHQFFKSLKGFPAFETTTVAQPPVQRPLQQAEDEQAQPPLPQEQSEQAPCAAGEAQLSSAPEPSHQAGPTEQPLARLGKGPAADGHQPPLQPGQEPAEKSGGGTEGPLQCIQVSVGRAGARGSGGGGQKRKWHQMSGWAGGQQDFVRFVLYKENMDSQVALSTLSRLLHLNQKVFGVAGTKDKRAVTVQAVTAYRVDPGRLAALNSRLRRMRLGNFCFCPKGLWLGDLQGNRFEIILRNIEAESTAIVEAAAEGLRRSGFVNYYGLQRFGSGAVATHRVGQALLRGQWQEAIRLILKPSERSRPEVVAACNAFLEEGDVGKALQLMPNHLVAERAVLQGLKQHGPSQALQALMAIPRNLRTMYLHAYQSYLWNAAASHRVSAYPHDRPVAGDLVLLATPPAAASAATAAAGGAAGVPATADAAAAAQQASGDEGVGVFGGGRAPGEAGMPAAASEDAAAAAGGEVSAGQREAGSVHVVTEEDAAAGLFRMEDVVLPLPGSQIVYPRHATAQVYSQVGQQDGISLSESPHSTREFMLTGLPGDYRRVMHFPADLQYELLRYDDPDQELAGTDLTELEGGQLPPPAPEGKYLAVRLSFQLPTSCYATMLIRELTKMDTSTEFQRTLQH